MCGAQPGFLVGFGHSDSMVVWQDGVMGEFGGIWWGGIIVFVMSGRHSVGVWCSSRLWLVGPVMIGGVAFVCPTLNNSPRDRTTHRSLKKMRSSIFKMPTFFYQNYLM